jgi:hypothetical protein
LGRNAAGDVVTSEQAAAIPVPPKDLAPPAISQLPVTPLGGSSERALLRQTTEKDEVLVRMRRSGVDRPGIGQLRTGDVVAVTPAEAAALMANGAADLFEELVGSDAVESSPQPKETAA